MYVYSLQLVGNRHHEVDFMSPKLDFKKGDVIELNGAMLSTIDCRFKEDVLYQFEIHKVVWERALKEEENLYYVGRLLVVYAAD